MKLLALDVDMSVYDARGWLTLWLGLLTKSALCVMSFSTSSFQAEA